MVLIFPCLHTYAYYCLFCGAGDRSGGYALLTMDNKPETALYRAPTFSLPLCHMVELVHVCVVICLSLLPHTLTPLDSIHSRSPPLPPSPPLLPPLLSSLPPLSLPLQVSIFLTASFSMDQLEWGSPSYHKPLPMRPLPTA